MRWIKFRLGYLGESGFVSACIRVRWIRLIVFTCGFGGLVFTCVFGGLILPMLGGIKV